MEYIGTLWKDEQAKLPIELLDDAGAPVTDKAYTEVTVSVAQPGDSVLNDLVLDAAHWQERGMGLYYALIDAGTMNAEGTLLMNAAITASGDCPPFKACANIETRPELRLTEYASGNNVTGVGEGEASADLTVLVHMTDGSGAPVTGLAYTDITVQYAHIGHTSMQNYAPTVDQWTELGDGCYWLVFDSTLTTQVGQMVFTVIGGTAVQFTGSANIVTPIDTQVWDAAMASHDVAGSFGEEMNDGRDVYEPRAVMAYDEATTTFRCMCWLLKNGRIVTTPTSAIVALKPSGGTALTTLTSSSPTANGVFYVEDTDLDLTGYENTPFEVSVDVTYATVSYAGVVGALTFN